MFQNQAAVSQTHALISNAVDVTVNCSDITVTKEVASSSISASETAVFKIVVTNSGRGTAYNVTLKDTLPAGVSCSIVTPVAGGATSMKIMDMLKYAASQSNAGGSMWYGNVKTTQGLAKDAFDAINNQWVFAP